MNAFHDQPTESCGVACAAISPYALGSDITLIMANTAHLGRKWLAGPMALIACLPLAGGAVMAETMGRTPVTATSAPPVFEASFERFNTLDTDATTPEIDPGAVDITSFDPPIEVAPKPQPARATRSLGAGIASYYGKRFHGRLTANGERFNMNAMTAAHKTLPFGTRVRVTHARNGKSVVVRINDRGPFIRGRTIDLSRAAAQRIGMISSGHARVKLAIIS